ncbi:MATH domain and coiled-coil domain-containing protein At3g58270-like isoform X2 [Prosopis cineraria]|uniref:MATH domain and coiled-coil domain-containing protein At3g58270-like isoform X2 n=1 Tax=Prosopis cineraria TaxID=364024 RepID=UPI00240EBBB4|nr:MATH domain and coiled-coil domain-containing protein At3g58270-like isoform X2 [Prosopis cineraria]
MENQQGKGIVFKKFTWVVQDFSKNKTKKQRSKAFEAGGCKWRILVNPIGKGEEYLSLFLKAANSLPLYGWTRYVYFKLSLVNQIDSERSISRETQQKFNAGHSSWGASFLLLSDFYNTIKDKISNQTHEEQDKTEESTEQLEDHQCIYFSDGTPSYKSSDEYIWNQSSQAESEIPQKQEKQDIVGAPAETPSPNKPGHYEPTAPPLYPRVDVSPVEIPLSPLSDLIDYQSLKPEEVGFVLLLEDVCSRNPSLIESQKKRSPKFTHWAFIALGQVLHFLKTTKAKNMDESACNYFQGLWEEVQLFGFDLTWLEPHVQYALGMKDYLERAKKVKKLEEEVVALENEMKKLRACLAATEVDLNIERRHLRGEEKGFEEKDVDAILDYGII